MKTEDGPQMMRIQLIENRIRPKVASTWSRCDRARRVSSGRNRSNKRPDSIRPPTTAAISPKYERFRCAQTLRHRSTRQHVERAVRKVDEAHDAEYQRKPAASRNSSTPSCKPLSSCEGKLSSHDATDDRKPVSVTSAQAAIHESYPQLFCKNPFNLGLNPLTRYVDIRQKRRQPA